jgi:glycerol-3-phosphate dehydrogenase subunit B
MVIGAGFAGMVAAARAATLGLKTVQAGSSSSLYFASGLFDLLGVYAGNTLEDPRTGLALLQDDDPGHPYAKTDSGTLFESFDFLKTFLKSAGLNYHQPNGRNMSVLTSAGTFKPTYMIPETFYHCRHLEQHPRRLLLIDFKGLREFSAKQIQAVLKKKQSEIFTLTMAVPGITGVVHPMVLAKSFENSSFLDELVKKIKPFAGKVDLVGMPAVCGMDHSLEIMNRLKNMTGLDFFEIPGMPPSIPGLRLKHAFEKSLSDITFLSNTRVNFAGFNGPEFIFTANTPPSETRIEAKGVILATGRFPGGGLHALRNSIRETIFNLPLSQPENRSQWHHMQFFEKKGHLINRAGIETDNRYRPVDQNKKPIFENLYAAGSILAHNDWVRLKSGSGVSCLTAYSAVNDFYRKL